MTPARFLACLASLQWSEYDAARAFGYSRGAVRNWQTGKARIPEPVADWCELITRYLALHPPPRRPE